MKSRLLSEIGGQRTFVVVFDTGDEVLDGILRFAAERGVSAASVTAIGAFERVRLGYWWCTAASDRIDLTTMMALIVRLAYNVTIYPIAVALWWLARRSVLRGTRAARLRRRAMPPTVSARRLGRRRSLAGLAGDLRQAGADPLVRGLFVSLEGFSASAVDFVELAVLLDRFKRSGKLLHVFVDRPDWRSLIAGRAADRLTTGVASAVMVYGPGVEVPFFGELLERYGVGVQAVQQGAYKGVMEPFTQRAPSPAFVESMQDLLDSVFERTAHELARRPDGDVGRARAALAEGPYTVTQAVERQLIDAAVLPEEAEDALASACRPGPARYAGPARSAPPQKGARSGKPLVALPDLPRAGIIRPAPLPLLGRRRMAFVPVEGLLVDQPRGMLRHQVASAGEIAQRIRRLADARGTEALVLVVDSRGGTVTASEMIWSAARYALAKKPVVAWMRKYAASGGYYVAAAAERIIASPFTITGSIGVVAWKPNVSQAAAHLGIHPVLMARGGGAALFSPFRPFTPSELAWLDAYTAHAYERFKAIVAEGRRISIDEVEHVARGRVWTGPQAHERGLVDAIGTLDDVVDAARELAGIPAAKEHEIVWAGPRQGLRQIARRLAGGGVADALAEDMDGLADLLLLGRERGPLYYLPAAWDW